MWRAWGVYLVTVLGAAWAARGELGEPRLLYKLSPSSVGAGDQFGWKVASEGDLLAVAAGQPQKSTGYVDLFELSSGQYLRRLAPPEGRNAEYFGSALSMNGGGVLVGNASDPTKGNSAGAAYLFDAGSGELVRTFYAEDGWHGDSLGSSVAMSGGQVLLGAPGAREMDEGAAYLFDRDSGRQLARFVAADGKGLDAFGLRVALTGRYALVGTQRRSNEGITGWVDVFDVETYGHVGRLQTGVLNDGFGWQMTAKGDLVAVTTYQEQIYVYDLESGEMVRRFGDGPADPMAIAGSGVDLDGDRLLTGAYRLNGSTGALWLIDDGGERREFRSMTAPDGKRFDLLGESVALNGDYLIGSARGVDDRGDFAGAVYVFVVPEAGVAGMLGMAAVALAGRRTRSIKRAGRR